MRDRSGVWVGSLRARERRCGACARTSDLDLGALDPSRDHEEEEGSRPQSSGPELSEALTPQPVAPRWTSGLLALLQRLQLLAMLLGRELLGCVGVVAEARHAPANGHTMVSYGQLKAAMVGGQPEFLR